jgi:signal transduction histidine kinase
LVRADIGRIAQLISNLSKKTGKVGLTLDIENRVRAVGPNKIDREIVVSISDEGEGIGSIIVSSLFSKIVSAHFKRDRLGVSMSKVLWKLMVGTYGAEIMTITRVQHLPLVYRCEKSDSSI